MDLIEGIYSRVSVRGYKPDPVPKSVLLKVLEAASRAPSWSDTQTWEFAVVGGPVMSELKETMNFRFWAGVPVQPDIPFPTLSDILKARSRRNGLMLFEHLGIGREDKERRQEWSAQGHRLFDAPNAIIIHTDKSFGPYSIFDAGLAAQNLALAALAYGLGTCWAIQAVVYPDILRSLLNLPESRLIVLGTPVGYPDWDHPANKHRSPRESMDNLATWYGF